MLAENLCSISEEEETEAVINIRIFTDKKTTTDISFLHTEWDSINKGVSCWSFPGWSALC